MESVEKLEDIAALKENKIIGIPNLLGSKITFAGTGNILFVSERVNMRNCKIAFDGFDSVVYLNASKTKKPYMFNIRVSSDCVVFFGKNGSFNPGFSATVGECTSLIIGNDVMTAVNTTVQATDMHMIFSSKTYARINRNQRGVVIGDHCWLATQVALLKNTRIGSGSVIGFGSVLSGQTVPSNTIYAGNPAKPVKKDVFWIRDTPYRFRENDPNDILAYNNDDFIYAYDTSSTLDIDAFLRSLSPPPAEANSDPFGNAQHRLEVLKKLSANTDKNRFFIPENPPKG
ncbi:hypothetical protein FACS1894217_06920 [Clostridia bacterium]|nr:hypothetical protein FACS1894217_06920 [Clostridia bacterium]